MYKKKTDWFVSWACTPLNIVCILLRAEIFQDYLMRNTLAQGTKYSPP